MKTELVWMILPIVALLSQIGGTWWKAARRYFIPIVLLSMYGHIQGINFMAFVMAIHLYVAYTFPVTKFGDSIPNDWRNWVWLPFWGVFMCSSILWINWHYWPVTLTCGLLMATLVVLSNIPKTAKFFQWKFVEMFEGILALYTFCYFITQQP